MAGAMRIIASVKGNVMTFITATPKRLSRIAAIVAALAVTVSLGIAGAAKAEDTAAPKALTKADVEKIIEEYLMENGKVIMDSVDNYQRKSVQERSAEGLKNNYDKLYNDSEAPFIGKKDGDVVLVEFFDYNCGYCKRALPTVEKLVETDKSLKIVLIDFPILGPTSETAARWALAAKKQDKYFEFHRLMMEHNGQITDEALRDVGKTAGLDVDQAARDADSADVTAQIEKNRALAQSVGVTGTPAFTVDMHFFPGAVPVEELKKAIDEVRAQKKAK